MLYRGRLNGGRLGPAGVGEGRWAGRGKVWADDRYSAVGDYLRAASQATARGNGRLPHCGEASKSA